MFDGLYMYAWERARLRSAPPKTIRHHQTCPVCGRHLVNLYLRDRKWKCKQCWDKEEQKMNVKITPHKPGDGGIMAMPMRKNIPVGHDDWKLVKCPICGDECWETDLHRQTLATEPGLKAACTMCALRAGLAGGGDE